MAFTKVGYGQVEPNHLSAMRTHQIYAQLPAKAGIAQLENGQFAKYDIANGCVDTAASANGEYMLVLNEVKLYGEKVGESYKDFVMKPGQFTDGQMFPRLYKTNIGDIMTTNNIKGAVVNKAKLTVGSDGILTVNASPAATDMVWIVVDAGIGMPDGTDGAKIQRIQ